MEIVCVNGDPGTSLQQFNLKCSCSFWGEHVRHEVRFGDREESAHIDVDQFRLILIIDQRYLLLADLGTPCMGKYGLLLNYTPNPAVPQFPPTTLWWKEESSEETPCEWAAPRIP